MLKLGDRHIEVPYTVLLYYFLCFFVQIYFKFYNTVIGKKYIKYVYAYLYQPILFFDKIIGKKLILHMNKKLKFTRNILKMIN